MSLLGLLAGEGLLTGVWVIKSTAAYPKASKNCIPEPPLHAWPPLHPWTSFTSLGPLCIPGSPLHPWTSSASLDLPCTSGPPQHPWISSASINLFCIPRPPLHPWVSSAWLDFLCTYETPCTDCRQFYLSFGFLSLESPSSPRRNIFNSKETATPETHLTYNYQDLYLGDLASNWAPYMVGVEISHHRL